MTLRCSVHLSTPDPPCPDSVGLPRGRPVAKFSRKAQCEPWMGQDAPGRPRAKAGAREGGSTCLAVFRGPTRTLGTGMRTRDRPAPGEVAGLGHGRRSWATRSMLSKERNEKGKQPRGRGRLGGMSLQAEMSQGHRPAQPGSSLRARGRPGLWRQADRRVSPGKAHRGSGSAAASRNLWHFCPNRLRRTK